MIVDDSPIARAVIARMLAPHPDFEVAAVAANAAEALAVLAETRVDLVLLDVEMPGTSGLDVLPEILARGARVLIVSSTCGEGAEAVVKALALGAADTLPKPGSGALASRFSEALVERIRLVGGRAAAKPVHECPGSLRLRPAPAARLGCLAVGASTGGLHAIAAFLRALPPRIGAPLLLTQHLPTAFIPFFARQIEAAAGRPTRIAADGAPVRNDEVVLAPGDAHLRLARQGGRVFVRCDPNPAPSGCLPSVDVMLGAAADIYGSAAVGVVLSGMGRDGLAGARMLVERGGCVFVQDRASSAVWGMPRAIAEAGLASAVLPPDLLASRIALGAGPWT